MCADSSLDKASPRSRPHQGEDNRYSSRIEAMKESLHLFNVWRKLNPTTRHYSFRRGLAVSRLNYWFASEHMLDSHTTSNIVPYPLSDHASNTIQVVESPPPTGSH